ncbi:HAD family hydrolase [Clostridium beijerinckii]|uniref:HAD family hydrolase n=1 Tax=Clostridium beijerinckii TaxID=1520 RepID=A0A0B5QL78_CLOBE|nr:HAD-IIA family hydrolase [Clostridium beijerinckii]AJH01651.1 HAD family hydrolase [Clostridium beijerinckii]
MLNKYLDIEDEEIALLKKIKCFILDLDGTVYLGNTLLNGSIEFLRTLDKNNIKFKFFTNNSSKNAEFYINKITNMGYNVKNDMMMISNEVIIDHIKKELPNKSVFVLGNEYLKKDFINSDINVVEENADVVVVGFDTSLAYKNVSKACDFIRNGATFLGVNPDFNCPIENGFMPDCGSICSMITASTGVKPTYFGKPSSYTLNYILNDMGLKEEEVAFVGDRLYTDIAIGKGNKAVTILVLTGETQMKDLKESDIQPTLIFNSLKEIGIALDRMNILGSSVQV